MTLCVLFALERKGVTCCRLALYSIGRNSEPCRHFQSQTGEWKREEFRCVMCSLMMWDVGRGSEIDDTIER